MNKTALLILGQRIQHYRKLAGLTQEELGEKVDMSSNSISKIECGAKCPRLENFINIAEAIHVTPDQLILGLSKDGTLSQKEILMQQIHPLTNHMKIEIIKEILASLDK